MKLHSTFCFLSIVFPILSNAQESNLTEVRSLWMKENNISTIVYNTGSISNPGVTGNILDFTWKGLGYAYEFGFMVGSKVPMANTADSVMIVSEGFGSSSRSTADGDFAPNGIQKWGLIPISGYALGGQKEIANNQDPLTWPGTWTEWPGKHGPAIADLEAYYVMNDFSNAEFEYYPFPSDSSKRGLGLQIDARYFQFNHPQLEDVFISTFDIRNAGEKALPEIVAGIFGDPHIGGPNNFGDDAANIDTSRGLAYSWDPDNVSDIPPLPPGYFGTMITESPADRGLTSFAAIQFGGNNRPKNDDLMYEYMKPGSFVSAFVYPPAENVGDGVVIMGTGYFALETDSAATIGIVYLLADNLENLKKKADIVDRSYDILFMPKGESIAITSPAADQTVQSNSVHIQWNMTGMNGDSTMTLLYSNVYGAKWWNEIAHNVPNTGTYDWNIDDLPDGVFYKVYAANTTDGTVSFDSTEGFFTVNKPGDAAPNLALLGPVKNRYTGTIPVTWIAGDAEGDPITVKVYYSDNDGVTYALIAETDNSGMYQFDSRTVANTPYAKLNLEASANGLTAEAETPSFRIVNPYLAITDTSSMKHLSGNGTGTVFPGIADSSALNGHTYSVSFDSLEGSLRYSLFDKTAQQMKIHNAVLNSVTGSGTLVDGMRIWFKNESLGIDSLRSGFDTTVSSVEVKLIRPSIGIVKHAPIDVVVEFGSFDLAANGDYLFPLDSAGTSNPANKTVRMPFKMFLLNDTASLQILIKDQSTTGKLNRWDFGEEIIVLTPPPYRSLTTNTHIGIFFNRIGEATPVIPPGRRFIAKSTRPLTKNDLFEFTAESTYGQPTDIIRTIGAPLRFHLEQNFPNPFNPVTTIAFSIPQEGQTSVMVYDIMGREVKTLVNEWLEADSYRIQWNGKNNFSQPVSSGIYFVRLLSGSSVSTKKMILMK
ncbi:MAG: T9SS type A sorting domain-containing protein [Bacteroidota bacterium]